MTKIHTHPETRKLLQRARQINRISHGYIISGPEGAGKRTIAMEFAASLVCEKYNFPPCEKCAPCKRTREGNHPDINVITADGKYIKVKMIKELSRGLHYHSYEGGYKAGVIFESERMNEHAQNAFLKTLEEPPENTVLILTCSNISRLLPTILSRCQIIRVGAFSSQIIEELITNERGLSGEQASLVSSLSQGNARRALDMDLDFVLEFRKEMIEKLLEIDREDRIGILDFAEVIAKSSYPAEDILDILASFYHDVLYIKLGRDNLRHTDLVSKAAAEAKRNSIENILSNIENICRARTRAAGNANNLLNWEILTMSLKGIEGAEINII
jgi:DNA polymerase III subunit delta'